MSLSLTALEAKRSVILQQFVGLGDLRPGSISAVVRRCGKPNCHCAKPKDPGHDPQLRLIRKVNGKSLAESFASPASFHKAQREVAEFHHLQSLSVELIALNEQICRLRPIELDSTGWTAQEKKRVLQSIKKSRANSTHERWHRSGSSRDGHPFGPALRWRHGPQPTAAFRSP